MPCCLLLLVLWWVVVLEPESSRDSIEIERRGKEAGGLDGSTGDDTGDGYACGYLSCCCLSVVESVSVLRRSEMLLFFGCGFGTGPEACVAGASRLEMDMGSVGDDLDMLLDWSYFNKRNGT